MIDEHEVIQPRRAVRRVRRKRKRSLKSRAKHVLKSPGTSKKLYLVAAGIIAVMAAILVFDMLFAVFP